MKKTYLHTVAAIALLSMNLAAEARPQGDRRGPPPQAAIDACQGQSESADCTMVGRDDQTLEGKCRTVPSGEFACVPNDHPGRMPGGNGDEHPMPGDRMDEDTFSDE